MSFPVPETISVPAGSIELRDARTTASRTVELRSFRIAPHPVTWDLYSRVRGVPVPSDEDADAPAHSVSWLDAVGWCNALSVASGLAPTYDMGDSAVSWDVGADGFRLPTEAEWEWACRARSTGPRYGPLPEIAWTDADAVTGTQRVGRKRPNAFGLFDMLGNVWEWCWDYADPARYADYRALRGGGWADKHWSVRASARRGTMPGTRLDDVGFRLVQGAAGETSGHAGQGWSEQADRDRARIDGPVPDGWTPLRVESILDLGTPPHALAPDLPRRRRRNRSRIVRENPTTGDRSDRVDPCRPTRSSPVSGRDRHHFGDDDALVLNV